MINKIWGNKKIWEDRYSNNQAVNRYPYNKVVSFVLRNYGKSKRSNIRLLDYGCGGGNHSAFLINEGFDTYGIDYSSSAINHTINTIKDYCGKTNENNFVCHDFLKLPYDNNFFDAVIDRQSLGQNPASNLVDFVSEIHRVLKPGGRYFGINFSINHPQLKFGKHYGNNDFSDFNKGIFKGIGSRHFFSSEELLKLFNKFIIEELIESKELSLVNENTGNAEFTLQAKKNDNLAHEIG